MTWTDIPTDLRDDRAETYTVYRYPDGSVKTVAYWRTGETPPDPEVRTNPIAQGLNEAAQGVNATAAAINAIVGGTVGAIVATGESTASTSYTDLTTTTDSVTVTIGSSGKALVLMSVAISGSGGAGWMAYALSGANTVAATDAKGISFWQPASHSEGRSGIFLETGLSPGETVFKAKYRATNASYTQTFTNRRIAVIPFP